MFLLEKSDLKTNKSLENYILSEKERKTLIEIAGLTKSAQEQIRKVFVAKLCETLMNCDTEVAPDEVGINSLVEIVIPYVGVITVDTKTPGMPATVSISPALLSCFVDFQNQTPTWIEEAVKSKTKKLLNSKL